MSLATTTYIRPHQRRQKRFDEAKEQILRRLDILAEFKAIGLRIPENASVRDSGWIQAHALGREDRKPSAAINIRTGYYKDSGGIGQTLSFWDAQAKFGRFPDWYEALKHFADKTGVPLPERPKDSSREHVEEVGRLNPVIIRGFLERYPEVRLSDLEKAGCRLVRYPKWSRQPAYCIAWPFYGPQLTDAPHRGYVLQPIDGRELENYRGERHKRLAVGANSGLSNWHSLNLLAQRKLSVVIKVEGYSDMMALLAIMPDEEKERVGVITNACGATERSLPNEVAEVFAGVHLVIIHDADDAGQTGAKRWISSTLRHAKSVRNVILFDEIEKKSGKDLRDWILQGHTWEELKTLIDSSPPVTEVKKVSKRSKSRTEVSPPEKEAENGASPNEPAVQMKSEPTFLPGVPSITDLEGRTDISNCRRFVVLHGDRVRFCHPWNKWLVWDDRRWTVDSDGAVSRLAMSVSDYLWYEARQRNVDEGLEFAAHSAGQSRINAMIALARSDLPVGVDELDRQTHLLNCLNGTVDLRTGEIRPHRQEDYITKLCPVEFHPDATCPRFEKFLTEVFEGDEALLEYLQRFFGYAATADVREQILTVFHGHGSNGKSTLLESIMATLGPDYASAAARGLLMESRGDSHPTSIADLFGRRLVVCQETEANHALAESVVKMLTGGDMITARRMREDFWNFRPTHKLVLCTNHKPRIKGTDHAIWRRIRLVPFNVRFEGDRKDKSLPEALRKEAEGILSWIVRGAVKWYAEGLTEPETVMESTRNYRNDSDLIGQFVVERCILGAMCSVQFALLYKHFEEWATDMLDYVPSKRTVTTYLRETLGLKDFKNNGLWFRGITLRDPLDDSDNGTDGTTEGVFG